MINNLNKKIFDDVEKLVIEICKQVPLNNVNIISVDGKMGSAPLPARWWVPVHQGALPCNQPRRMRFRARSLQSSVNPRPRSV